MTVPDPWLPATLNTRSGEVTVRQVLVNTSRITIHTSSAQLPPLPRRVRITRTSRTRTITS